MSGAEFVTRARRRVRKLTGWIRQNIAPGLRFILGLILIVGGLLGFLPVLGFWMVPLGIAVVLMDVRPFAKFLTRKFGRRGRK